MTELIQEVLAMGARTKPQLAIHCTTVCVARGMSWAGVRAISQTLFECLSNALELE